jgi:hypothetical protein
MKTKKALTILLSLLLVFATASPAFSASYNDINNNPYKDAILEMSSLGILEGVGNNQFAPDRELNRAAAAKVSAYLLGYTEEDAADAAKWTPLFDDIQGTSHQWALGWINLMAKEGILLGVGEGAYAPGNALQMVHWATILTRVLDLEEEGMAWPGDYNEMAVSLGLGTGLSYVGSQVMNRGQMAQMTNTTLYEVPRSDGNRIVDMVEFPGEREDVPSEPWDGDETVYENTQVGITLSRSLVPAGGGQSVVVTVKVTHGTTNAMASGTPVSFMAHYVDGTDRSDQFSSISHITDQNGIATATYTTLQADDNKSIILKAAIQDGDDWIDQSSYLLASNTAGTVSGTLINPFNGQLIKNTQFIFVEKNSSRVYSYENPVSSDGSYSIGLLPGSYYMDVQIDVGNSNPYSGEFITSDFDVRSDGMVQLKRQISLSQGQPIQVDLQRGILTGIAQNFPVGTDLYIVNKSNNYTVATKVRSDGRFMVALLPGTYEVHAFFGTIYKNSVPITKGTIHDIGSFTR